jgi:hypothetical protein
MIALFLLFLALGAAGWKKTLEEASGHATVSDIAENTIEMISGHDVIVVDHKFEEHWMLMVGKWGLKGVFAAALLQSGLILFRRQIRQWRFRKAKGHQIFAGCGQHNVDLALRAAAKGQDVAVICEDEHHPRRSELERAGVIVFVGIPEDSGVLKAAGIERAQRVTIAATAGDDASLATAEVVASTPTTGGSADKQMVACLHSRPARDLLNQRWSLITHPGTWQARIVSFEAAALRQMVTRVARDLADLPDMLQRGPRLLVVADHSFTHEFLRAAIAFVQISGKALPEYWVVVEDESRQQEFAWLFPAAFLVAKVHFVLTPLHLAPVCPSLAGISFDLGMVRMEGESQTLQLADSLLNSSVLQVSGVEAVVDHSVKTQLDEDSSLRINSIYNLGLNSPEFGDLSLDQKARQNHEAYVAGLTAEERAKSCGWDQIPEHAKESNRWAILHREIKLQIWNRAEEARRLFVLEHLAICEHQRWMGEKAMNGWRHAALPEQDKKRRLHPSLISWDQLSDSEKEKDRVQVRKGLGVEGMSKA